MRLFGNPQSFLAYCLSSVIIFSVLFFYFPRWNLTGTEGAFGWDVSGYYLYLPAIFVYHDLKQLEFKDAALEKYQWTPEFHQAFPHESGNYVMKYSGGMALMYMPFFLVAHFLAPRLGYPADGFSTPYQVAILWGSLLITFIGLWFLRKVLLKRYSDTTTAIVLLAIVFATNYFNSSAFGGAMSHNWLFTVYAILIFLTDKFYGKPAPLLAAAIGGLVGVAALTRPTECIIAIIPLLWGIKSFRDIPDRMAFFKKHFNKVFLSIIACLAVGSLQIIYWKYVSGDFFVYSYQEQGFSWLSPHLADGIFSYRQGWLVYTPMMFFALFGFVFLYKHHRSIFPAAFIFSCLFIYIAFAWDEWWYGGGLSQRAMVQSYPVLALPLAGFVEHIRKSKVKFTGFLFLLLLFSYYNLWLTYQAHGGGLFYAGFMTKAYFWKSLGRYHLDESAFKLLDTNEEFTGERKNIRTLYQHDFEQGSASCTGSPISGKVSLCLNKENQYSPRYSIPLNRKDADWVRAHATFRCSDNEWNFWGMTQFSVSFKKDEQNIKTRMLRVNHFLKNGEAKQLFLDVKIPKKEFNSVEVQFWNVGGHKEIIIDDLVIEAFEEK